jgi:hypothetical protein
MSAFDFVVGDTVRLSIPHLGVVSGTIEEFGELSGDAFVRIDGLPPRTRMSVNLLIPFETAWGAPMPEGCTAGKPSEHAGYSDYDGECRDCGYGSGEPTCESCQ